MENNHCGEIVSLNISRKKGTIKTPQDQFVLTELGIDGDAHAGRWHRQISLLADESVKKFASQSDRDFLPGEFAENITTRGIDLLKVAVFDRFHIGDVLLEVTQLGKKCHGGGCAIYREVGKCVMPKEGIFCRVLKPGVIKPGDTIRYEKRPLTFKIITLSTRASLGEYEDRSGPHIKEKIVEAFEGKPWQVEFDTVLIGDDSKKLEQEIMTAVDRRVPFIFTTGGTGIGKSDITPDTLEASFREKASWFDGVY